VGGASNGPVFDPPFLEAVLLVRAVTLKGKDLSIDLDK